MAKIKLQDIADKDLLSPLVKDAQDLSKAYADLRLDIQNVANELKKSAANQGTSSREVKKLKDIIESLQAEKKRLTIVEKEEQKIKKTAIAASKAQAQVEKRLLEIAKDKERAGLKAIKSIQDQEKARKRQSAADKRAADQAVKATARENAAKERQIAASQRVAARKEKERAKQVELNRSYNVASRTLNELRKKYKDLAVENKGTTKEARRLLVTIGKLDRKLKQVDNTVGQNQRSVGKYGDAFKGLRGGLLNIAGSLGGAFIGVQALGTAFREAFTITRDYNEQVSKLQAVLGATDKDAIQPLIDNSKDLGETTQFSATQVAQLSVELAKLGFTQEEILQSSAAILDAAVFNGTDLARTAEVYGATINAFSLGAGETRRVADVTSKAFASSALDLEKFATAIAIVGPAAEATGFSIEETTAILGKVADAGIDASSAGSALRNIFIDIADKGITFQEALDKIANSQNRLQTANELFGKRGAVVSKVIADNAGEISKLNEELLNSEGAAAAAAKIVGNTLSGDIKILQSVLESVVLSGDGFNNFLRFSIQFLTGLIKVLKDVASPFVELGRRFSELVKSFGFVSKEGGFLAGALKTVEINIKLMLLPIRLLIDLFISVAEIYKDLNDAFTSSDFFKDVVDGFNAITDAVNYLNDVIPFARDLVNVWGDAFDFLADETSGAIDKIAGYIGISGVFTDSVEETTEAVDKATRSLSTFSTTVDNVGKANNTLLPIFEKLRSSLDGFSSLSGVTDFIERLEKGAKDAISIQGQVAKFESEFRSNNTKEISAQIRALREFQSLKTDTADIQVIKARIKELENEKDVLINGVDANKDLSKTLVGLREKRSDLIKQRDVIAATDEKAIADKNIEIDTIGKQIKALEELGKARQTRKDFEVVDVEIGKDLTQDILNEQERRNKLVSDAVDDGTLTAEQQTEILKEAEKDFQKNVTDLQIEALRERIINAENFGQDTLALEKQLNDLILEDKKTQIDADLAIDKEALDKKKEQDKKDIDAEKEKQKQIAQEIKDGAEIAEAIADRLFEKKLKRLDDEVKNSQEAQEKLANIAETGTGETARLAEDALAFEKQNEAERLIEKEKALKRQQQVEFLLAGVKAFGAKVEAGDQSPVRSVLSDVSVLVAGIKAIKLKKGTDRVGDGMTKTFNTGEDDYLARLHEGEKVFTAEDSAKIGYDITNSEAADIVYSRLHGNLLTKEEAQNIQSPSYSYSSTDPRLLSEQMKTNELLNDMKGKLGTQYVDYDNVLKVFTEVRKEGNKVTTNTRRINGLNR